MDKPLPPKHGHDKDICKLCRNMGMCSFPCAPLLWIDGNTARKENLVRDHQNPSSNYNQTLSELIVDKTIRDEERIEIIRLVPQPRRKMIMACILVGLSQQEISKQAHISQSRISRIYQGLTKR